MRSVNFFISACNRMCSSRFSVTTCGARPMVVKPGRSCRPTGAGVAAISSGSRLIGPTGRDTGFNTRQTMALTALAAASNSSAPRTAGQRGNRLSLFQIHPYMERSMWTRMATFLLVAGAGAQRFAVFVQATHRSQARHRLLIETQLLASVAPSFRAALMEEDFVDKRFL